MPSLYTEIEMNAPKSAVWRTLICKEEWLKWNTFLYDRNPALRLKQGQTVQLSLRRLREETETEFEPRITLLQPEICLRWIYSAPGFRSEHTFELQEIGRNRTKYIHQETFSGLMTVLFIPFLRRDEQQGLRRMARELKQYVEGY
ncbi:MAG: SRPBCC domain-containing protein [Cyanobacteria bacterium CRU_2_1]|nr:SRPBCC domain-containing protein [Cyanobacteria bacterium RU_5_0]NJR59931.1 SRPBCC domain-containing protein [Cyanobacteria bacterium CRU_2_1]